MQVSRTQAQHSTAKTSEAATDTSHPSLFAAERAAALAGAAQANIPPPPQPVITPPDDGGRSAFGDFVGLKRELNTLKEENSKLRRAADIQVRCVRGAEGMLHTQTMMRTHNNDDECCVRGERTSFCCTHTDSNDAAVAARPLSFSSLLTHTYIHTITSLSLALSPTRRPITAQPTPHEERRRATPSHATALRLLRSRSRFRASAARWPMAQEVERVIC